ncbi:MAG: arginine--tRNA ligase [Anaerolineales bacterium]
MFQLEQIKLNDQIKDYCSVNELPVPEEIKWNPIPFDGEWGISTSFFQLAADEARQSPIGNKIKAPVPKRAQEIASEIASHLGIQPGYSKIEAKNGYLNIYFATSKYSQRIIDKVIEDGVNYGCAVSRGKQVMVEFSQPNTHKAFHVGHLRNVILGSVICNILECAGYSVIRVNYIGDIGWHVIKWLWNYLNFHEGEKPTEDTTRWMGEIYSEAEKRLEENPEYEPEIRQLFSRWDNRDPDIVALWKETREWSLEGFEQIYNLLGVNFDRIYFESEVEDSGKDLVEDLISKGIAEDERPEGPVIIRIDDILQLEKEKFRVLVILRSDGTSLYATKDLPLAILKFEEYDLDRSIYIIDVRQSLYLQQVFKTLEIMGYPWAKDCYHLAYEIVNLPGNVTMKSRDGTVVLLEDLIREANARAYKIVAEKNPGLSENDKKGIAEAVALGAIKYTMLARENEKIVTFDWESALNFDGQAAPYIQYACVRANSILRRSNEEPIDTVSQDYELDPTEVQLIDLISRLPSEIQRAAEDLKPLHLTNLAYSIAKAFSDFYNQCPVLKAAGNQRIFRLRLVMAVRQALTNLMNLLGITPLEKM